jgi:hypothetical protein
VSLVEVLGSAPNSLAVGFEGESESLLDSLGLSLAKFMAHVSSVVMALMLGARLEGFKPRSVRLTVSDDGIPSARAIVEFDGATFLIYAKPYIDVADVDEAADEAAELAESCECEVVPVLATFELSYYAERYAKSLGMEIMRLGL